MEKANLDKFTFIFHIRIDTDERLKNIETVLRYYQKTCTNFHCIFIEDSKDQRFYDMLQTLGNDGPAGWTYHFTNNGEEWNKCKAFNYGIKNAETEFLIFHDVDVIIKPQQFLGCYAFMDAHKDEGLMYPYNGCFYCISPQIKKEFSKSLDYNDLKKYTPAQNTINYYDGNVLVGHNNSVGGCVIGRKSIVTEINGYNPNFKGWGFEDNEFPKRMRILDWGVTRLGFNNTPLWHMPHEGPGASPKAENKYYHANGELCKWVETQTKDVLQKYIKTWTI